MSKLFGKRTAYRSKLTLVSRLSKHTSRVERNKKVKQWGFRSTLDSLPGEFLVGGTSELGSPLYGHVDIFWSKPEGSGVGHVWEVGNHPVPCQSVDHCDDTVDDLG